MNCSESNQRASFREEDFASSGSSSVIVLIKLGQSALKMEAVIRLEFVLLGTKCTLHDSGTQNLNWARAAFSFLRIAQCLLHFH
jgi:hypothetical protein